jgi:hypothetical protein
MQSGLASGEQHDVQHLYSSNSGAHVMHIGYHNVMHMMRFYVVYGY